MEIKQEDALFEFLDNNTEPFVLEDIVSHVQAASKKKYKWLSDEIKSHLEIKHIAFKIDSLRWISRRGCFESVEFAIAPSRLELLNGILIPGHRCVPFANPMTLPNNYQFFWKGKKIPLTTTEAPPEDLYPYYCIYGEEFAPQFIARENPENEAAFNEDPFDDPVEVSIQSLDMRTVYRESSFIPGDRFLVKTLNWKDSFFELKKIPKNEWSDFALKEWMDACENGFKKSFTLLGPGASTEEQIAYAYWYGGQRMREVPALSLEEFLYEKTENIETTAYGIETRFWYARKEIPDSQRLLDTASPPDKTFIEELMLENNIPISEFVILSYIRDAFYRNEVEIDKIIDRVIPPVFDYDKAEWDIIAEYIADCIEELYNNYSLFLDKDAGPLRQRVIELHTAVIELAEKLQKSEMDVSWLPHHTFIILSQIQSSAASLLEDLAFEKSPPKEDLEAMENSLENMIETYSDVKEMISTSMDNFRRSNLTLIHGQGTTGRLWRIIQISLQGLDVWRRALIPQDFPLCDLHQLIQISMEWKNSLQYRFCMETPESQTEYIDNNIKINEIDFHGKKELYYEYGSHWTVSIMIMSSYQSSKNETVRLVTGAGAAPPENIAGTRHLQKVLNAAESGSIIEKQAALRELGGTGLNSFFELDKYNHILRKVFPPEGKKD
jgi:hypothetical protein